MEIENSREYFYLHKCALQLLVVEEKVEKCVCVWGGVIL